MSGSEGTSDRVRTAVAAVGRWAKRHRDAMVRVALARVKDRDVAEDVVQDALTIALDKALRKPEEVEGVSNPRAWLIRVTINVALNRARKRARRERIARENEAEIREQLLPEGTDHDNFEQLFEEALDIARQILKPEVLKVVEAQVAGKGDEQISQELGIARGTVRSRRYAAVHAIKEHRRRERGVS